MASPSVTTSPSVAVDFSKGGAFVQDGVLYYSPNCSRRVVIPPVDSLPFKDPVSDAHFTQPVWWSPHFGWRSCIPLSPSFTSLPFENLCWMPKIIDQPAIVGMHGSEKQFLMSSKDVDSWMKIETLLVRATSSLKFRFGNSSIPPPLPSSFGFTGVFKSFETAKSAIITSRSWFVIWMGFLSFIIAQSESQTISTSGLPSWNHHLLDDQFSPPWLDGLASSGVCSFDTQTLRAGVVFRWIYDDSTRPDIDWFFTHHIPLFFIWSQDEEKMISSIERLAHLRPPTHLLQQALNFLWKTPNLSLADLVIRRFCHLEGRMELDIDQVKALGLQSPASYVIQVVTKAYLKQDRQLNEDLPTQGDTHDRQADGQHTAKEAGTYLPFQSMIEMDEDDRGKLFTHFKEFFAVREKRQAELLTVESKVDRQRREGRERNPPKKKTKMFEWTWVTTSGGQTLHMRVLVPRRKHEYFHSELDADRRIYNAMANEWDVFSEFSPATTDAPFETNYEALFADPGSPDYHIGDLDEISRDTTHADGQGVPSHEGPSMESLPSDMISYSVPDRREVPTGSQQDPPIDDPSMGPPLPSDVNSYTEVTPFFVGDQQAPPVAYSQEPVIITDSSRPLPSDMISSPVPDRRDMATRAGGHSEPPSYDCPSMGPSDMISYDIGGQDMPGLVDVTDGRDIPTHAESQRDPRGQDVLTSDDNRQTESCMESMSSGATLDVDEGDSGLFELLQLTYGCANPLGLDLDVPTSCLDWRGVLLTLGIVKDPAKFLSNNDMTAIMVFISRLSSKNYNDLPQELDTLNPRNHLSLSGSFELRDVRRPVKDLFVFDTRFSSTCSWTLGVQSAAAALYVCRYILTNPVAHNILTVAHRLVKKGVPFRTLLLLPMHDVKPLSARTKPLSYRNPGYRYTLEDFEGSMLACKNLLKSPHGRAALLRGGIVGRIAREFLSLDAALDGPSVEVTKHHAGFMSPSHMRHHHYWDDDLTDQETDVICGTYVLWTGYGKQTVTLSWFPPPQVWNNQPSGFRWLEWTEKDESLFLDILLEIQTGKHQPLSNTQWRSKLRGFKYARLLITNNELRSQCFLDNILEHAQHLEE